MTNQHYDALLLISYGGPETLDEVRPFIENVLRGRPVSETQIESAIQKYTQIGGCSQINHECRTIMSGLLRYVDDSINSKSFADGTIMEQAFTMAKQLPLYWGNIFWHPLLEETVAEMVESGLRRIIAFCTVPFETSHSRLSYAKAIEAAIAKTSVSDLTITQTRWFADHPLYISAVADRLIESLTMQLNWDHELPSRDDEIVLSQLPNRAETFVIFTAHSVPVADAQKSNYEIQLNRSCFLVAESLQLKYHGIDWGIAYQSRGYGEHWCGPDVNAFVQSMFKMHPEKKNVVVCPIGFMLENMELQYDLDYVLQQNCRSLGFHYRRVNAIGGHRKAIAMIRELTAEIISPLVPRRYLG